MITLCHPRGVLLPTRTENGSPFRAALPQPTPIPIPEPDAYHHAQTPRRLPPVPHTRRRLAGCPGGTSSASVTLAAGLLGVSSRPWLRLSISENSSSSEYRDQERGETSRDHKTRSPYMTRSFHCSALSPWIGPQPTQGITQRTGCQAIR
ncbi:hypothetical protein H4582DRAFT_1973215 [Lactarius indigo]|nr:hypothetical protein H4582DRAFT_1973215 [Lactarius indigo]